MKAVLGVSALIRYTIIFGTFFIAGCSTTVNLSTKPPAPVNKAETKLTVSSKYDAVLEPGKATFEGNVANLNSGFQSRVYNSLKDLGAFENIYQETPANAPKKLVKINFSVAERNIYNKFLNGLKGAFIGASFFLLSPVIPLYSDFESSFKIRFTKPDNSYREYSATTYGEAEFYFHSLHTYGSILGSKVTEANFDSILRQIVDDKEWLAK